MTVRAIAGGWVKNGRGAASASSLSLNFLNGITDYRITYSGGANGTRVNEAGVIVAAVAPRYDYNPVTLAARGLLVEEARTNLLTYSEQFNDATWVKVRAAITPDTVVSPDGTQDADSWIEDTATGIRTMLGASVSYVSGTAYTASIYAKSASGARYLQLSFSSVTFGGTTSTNSAVFDLNAGTRIVGAALTSATITPAGNGWYRCDITKTATASNTSTAHTIFAMRDAYSIDVATGYTGDGTSGLTIWGAQLEAGAFATSYIPTVAATVTRTADSAVMTGTNFSSWYNQTEGTFVAAYSLISVSASVRNICTASDGTGNNRVSLGVGSSGTSNMFCFDGGVSQANIGTGNTATTGINKAANSYQVNNFALVLNGGTVATDVSGTVPTTLTQANIGIRVDASQPFNGWIQSIQYYPRRVSDSQLQILST